VSPATGERLSLDDAQILRLESAAIKGHTGKVLILAPDSTGSPLSVPDLRARVGDRMGLFPRLGQRIEMPRLSWGRPVWMRSDEVDLDWHVAEPANAEPLSDEEFRQAAGELLSERLDHSRPLWRLDALPLTGDRTGLIGRIHHAMADGISALRMVSGLLWDEQDSPRPQAGKHATKAPKAKPDSG
jgi:hypothetical protein